MPRHPAWEFFHPAVNYTSLGYLLEFLDLDDPRPAGQQLDTAYATGGGWRPFEGFQFRGDNSLRYPGDPPLYPLAQTWLRDELILYYEHDWVAVVQRDRSFEVCRMD